MECPYWCWLSAQLLEKKVPNGRSVFFLVGVGTRNVEYITLCRWRYVFCVKTDMSLYSVFVRPLLFCLRYFLNLLMEISWRFVSFLNTRGNNEGILLLNPFYCWSRNLLWLGTLSEIHMPKRIGRDRFRHHRRKERCNRCRLMRQILTLN